MQQITYNMLFRWFIGLGMDASVWDVTVLTKNRDRLLEGDIARGFPDAILADQPDPGRNGEHEFHGERRSNETHASMTEPDVWLLRRSLGQPAQLCHTGHLLMENRNGLVVDARLSLATDTAEREVAAAMLGDLPAGGRITVGADKLHDTQGFVAEMRRLAVAAMEVVPLGLG